MRVTPVHRTIERPARLFGLELSDTVLWLSTFVLLRWTILWAGVLITITWVALFLLRFRRPPRFLLSLIRYHAFAALCGNRFNAFSRERTHGAWLALRGRQ